jgi:hypothetical protein
MHTQLDTAVARPIVLLGTLRTALAGKTVSIIACPVDCSEKIKLTDKLGECEFVVDPA